MPERRPLTTREHEVGALILIGIGAPAESLRSTRTRVREVDPGAPGSGDGGGEVRACLDDPDWLELVGSSAAVARVRVRDGAVRVEAGELSDPADVARVRRAMAEALGEEAVAT